MWIGGVARLGTESLTYFNVLAGGRAGGHRWLLDSNLDWGQDDRRLERWLGRAARRGEAWAVNPPLDAARPGRFAVSANALHHLQRRSRGPYAWLVDLEPRALAGGTWRLYDLQATDFERRAAARPNDAAAQLAYAEVLESGGHTARAAALFAALAHRLAGEPEVARREARFALRQGDAARAQAAAARGLGVLPDDAELWRLQERARLEARLARATSRGPAAEAAAALALGLWRAESGELDAAWPLLERAARLDPGSLEAQRARAVALAHRGDFAAAAGLLAGLGPGLAAELRVCRRLADTEARLDSPGAPPPGVEALVELGRTHFDDGRFDRAARAFVAALRQNPRHGLALAHLGEMQVRSKLRIVAERLAPRSLVPGE
jgi:tetratricopeptide (TPR) repeat protein